MKRILLVAMLMITNLFFLTGCSLFKNLFCDERIEVFNWGAYMDKSLIKDFEKEYKICISFSTYASNEAAINKMKTQSFDVIFPSDYAVEQMVEEDLILPLDWSKLTSFNPETDIVPELKRALDNMKNAEDGFDFLNYSAPYFWGSVGIVYNKNKVSKTELEAKNWDILKDNKYKVAYYDSSRDGIMVPLKQLGYSMNTKSQAELTKAEEWLTDLRTKMKNNVSFLTDEILDNMPANRQDMALIYSGDALYTMTENDDLDFYKPKTGSNIFIDGMVIPKAAKNIEGAYKFINFMLEYEQALANTLEVGYSSTNKNVAEFVMSSEGEYYDYRDIYQVEINDLDEFFRYDAETKLIIQDIWVKIRALKV